MQAVKKGIWIEKRIKIKAVFLLTTSHVLSTAFIILFNPLNNPIYSLVYSCIYSFTNIYQVPIVDHAMSYVNIIISIFIYKETEIQ